MRLGTRVRCTGLALFAQLAASSCQQADESVCASGVMQAIFDGAPAPPGSSIEHVSTWAIGSIQSALGTELCTGTLITADRVLTAAHCVSDESFFLLRGTDGESVLTPLGSALVHPSADLALLQVVDPQRLSDAGFRPFPLYSSPLNEAVAPGSMVTLAGAGLTERGRRGELRFAQEVVVDVEPGEVTVSGNGASGACVGDSGGPLLLRTELGPRLVGVLREGSTNCRGIDIYLRIDAYQEWIARQVLLPVPGQEPEPCW